MATATKLKPKSRNPLSEEAKKTSGESLLKITANASVLYNHIKMAHWNLRDSNFIEIHRLLDDIAASVIESTDELAERARQLGHVVNANSEYVQSANILGDFPARLVTGAEVCDTLTHCFGKLVDLMHEAISQADEVGDAVTADIITQWSGKYELHLWLLESHLDA